MVENQSMDLLEVSRWVSILPWVSLVLWVLHAIFTYAAGLQGEFHELWPLFSSGGESIAGIGFHQAVSLERSS